MNHVIIPVVVVSFMLLLGIWVIGSTGQPSKVYARLASWSLGFFVGISAVWMVVCPILFAVFPPPRSDISLMQFFMYGEVWVMATCVIVALGVVFTRGRDTFFLVPENVIFGGFSSGEPKRHLFLGICHGLLVGAIVSLLLLGVKWLTSADWVDNLR